MALLIAVRIWDPPPVEALRLRTFDAYQALKPRVPLAQQPVLIVDIDEASLREIGQWPWPRTRVAELVTRLTRMGAIVVAFDIVFAEPDRLSPALVADALPNLDSATRDALRALPSNDQVLADTMRASRVILGQTALAERVEVAVSEPLPQTGFAMMGPDPSRFIRSYPGLLRNVPVLEQAASGRGLFTIAPEADGIVRRVPMVMKADGQTVPTLTLDILRVLTGAGAILVKSDAAGIQGVVLPGLELPTDSYGQIWVHFSPHDPSRFVSARDVLTGTVPAGRFTNKIVLVGTSAIGLLDNKTTPLDRAMPGVEVQAQLLESALTRSTLVVPNFAVVIELLVAIAVAFAIILFAPILGPVTLLLFGAAVAAALAAASWYRYSHSGILLDATFPLASSFLVYLTLVFTNYFREQLGRARIRSAFGQYLSPALVEQLAQSPEKLKLGGEERVLTIMFSDVRGFTGISESFKHDPQGLTSLMNRFLTPLTNAILNRKGTIDKYMGDAIMAFWNAPLDDPDQEANAAWAALEMLARMRRVNAEREAEATQVGGHAFVPINVGIGLNTGRCVVGNMGSDLRFDYSVLGDTVNLASRLEGQSKNYGIRIILGSSTADAIRDRFAVLEVDLIRVKGKTEPEIISTLVGDASVREQPAFASLANGHAEMIAAYRARDWDQALSLAIACKALAAGLDIDGLYDLYMERIAAYDLEPPPAGWAGVYVAETK
ncbi:CHASE2 domain-containing protein [uncultured Enterovirga sp.]|uniref:CHASE2 domain-containing protein n=1 Tax=uncultured Enterovirga sp. TaxID=2026352 RepID=UPI0035CB3747